MTRDAIDIQKRIDAISMSEFERLQANAYLMRGEYFGDLFLRAARQLREWFQILDNQPTGKSSINAAG
jgi:hypothetical protein